MDETNTEVAKPGIHSTEAQPELLETKTIGIAGMTSDRCVKKIEGAFRNHRGVREFEVDRENAMATITFDTRVTNMAALHDLLLRSGYKAQASAATIKK
jgi:copper chaperone CopZ